MDDYRKSIKEKLYNDTLFNRFANEIQKICDRLNKELSHVNNPLFVYKEFYRKWICVYTKTKHRRNVKIYFSFHEDVDHLEKVITKKFIPFSFYKIAYCFLYDIDELYEIIFNDFYYQINYWLKEDLNKKNVVNSLRSSESKIYC